MNKEIYKVTGIPSSFVFGDMKLLTDKGAGEAKLFVGPKRKEKEIDDFFQICIFQSRTVQQISGAGI